MLALFFMPILAEMTIKDAVVLSLLCNDVMNVEGMTDEYPMISQEETLPKQTCRDILTRLMKDRLIRYASSDPKKAEIRASDSNHGVKWYTATPQGREMLQRIRSVCARSGVSG